MALTLALGAQGQPQGNASAPPKCVVLGFDGLDPALLERWMGEGRLPAFQALAARGAFLRLRTSVPAALPVAWSNICLGVNPGRHGVFDVLRRVPQRYAAAAAAVDFPPGRVDAASGAFVEGSPISLRSGKPFWRTLDEAGVRTTIFNCPLTFPPDELQRGRMLSGSSTPDLGLGFMPYVLYTTALSPSDLAGLEASPMRRIQFAGPTAEALIEGPWRGESRALWREIETRQTAELGRLARAGAEPTADIESRLADLEAQQRALESEAFATVPMRLERLAYDVGLDLAVQGQREILRPGKWSRLFDLEFDLGGGKSAQGLCRFHLIGLPGEALGREIHLLRTAVEMHPEAPFFPISWPPDLAGDLARRLGLFGTDDGASCAAALQDERISDQAFLDDFHETFDQRERLFFDLYERDDWDLFFGVFTQADAVQRFYWRAMDPRHPRYLPQTAEKYADVIRGVYERMDRILGRVMEALPPEARLMVLSPYGFAPFYEKVNLNTALLEAGLLRLIDPKQRPETVRGFCGVDWKTTRAYALGFGQVFLNLKGREAAGCVAPGREAEETKAAVAQALRALRDPETNEPVVASVLDASEVYQGPRAAEGPDLIVGFRRGWRVDWLTPRGTLAARAVEANRQRCSADHCSVDSEAVAGVLLTNWKPQRADLSLLDIAPTLLELYGAEAPAESEGKAF